jgi:hypothetical protein
MNLVSNLLSVWQKKMGVESFAFLFYMRLYGNSKISCIDVGPRVMLSIT